MRIQTLFSATPRLRSPLLSAKGRLDGDGEWNEGGE